MRHIFSLLVMLSVVLGGAGLAHAHATITVEAYTLEYGWLVEPPVAGQPNAIILNLTAANPADTAPLELRVGGLTAAVIYGDQRRTLALQAAPGGQPGEYILPLTPSLPGVYTLELVGVIEGRLGLAVVDELVTPEEVLPLAEVAFPRVAEAAGNDGWAMGLSVVALMLAAAALGVSLWRKR